MAFLDYHYFSPSLNRQTSAYVLLPEVGTPPYPTLYLLHGYSDDHTIWLRRTSLERYVANLPLIVVMPDGGHGFYTDAAEGYAFDSAIARDLVERVEKTLPAKSGRENRVLAGLSMGGYGAFALALRHPELFCAAHSLSGALAWGHRKPEPSNQRWEETRRILGADPVGGPGDLFALVEKLHKAKTLPDLRFDCGTEDFLLDHNREFKAFLDEKKIPHEYEEFSGAHNWEYWDEHIQDALKFLGNSLKIKPQG